MGQARTGQANHPPEQGQNLGTEKKTETLLGQLENFCEKVMIQINARSKSKTQT